jgi:hypothetical protein
MPNLASLVAMRLTTLSIVDSKSECVDSTKSHFRSTAWGASAGNSARIDG